MRGVYAYLCTDCEHLASAHTWNPETGGSLVDGPYVCPCGCSQPQEGAFIPMTRRQYAARFEDAS